MRYKCQCPLAPNGLKKWGCRMRIRDLFSTTRLRDQKNNGTRLKRLFAVLFDSNYRRQNFLYLELIKYLILGSGIKDLRSKIPSGSSHHSENCK